MRLGLTAVPEGYLFALTGGVCPCAVGTRARPSWLRLSCTFMR